ncbi:UDP-glucoronosyl and UDP-glucosyl transferase domain-containing protein [Phthorimaea operculella]|nr:UDP-glucoronosyl and UDP-glucosyl transferase domain-containing protein [Phthorimaea operculella]
MRLFNFFVCVATLTVTTDAANILAYIPTPSLSHILPHRPLFKELAKRGHEVTVITTDPEFPEGKSPPNLIEIDVHDVSYGPILKSLTNMSMGDKRYFTDQMIASHRAFAPVSDLQLNSTAVQKAIHEKKYDLLFLEGYYRPALGLSYVQKAPVILLNSLGRTFNIMEAMGAPTHPILYPNVVTAQRVYNLTIWEKIYELYNNLRMQYVVNQIEESENKMLQKHFGKDIPPLSELYNNVDMVFLNTHPIWEGNHPVPPGVIYTWGIHSKPRKELPKDLQDFLDSSKHGVIYMSFGTNTDSTLLPREKIAEFVKVFCELPYDVLWKWPKDELPGRCKNIKIGKWFPQSDVLFHPNIKVFVTQGGLQSTDEALTAGVPMVGIPMLGDQAANTEKYVHFKIGVQLEFETLNAEKFKNAITTVINDDSYRENVKHLYALMHDQPMSGLQRAVWWTEHVLRHGGARHLRAPAANISWAQRRATCAVVNAIMWNAVTCDFEWNE